MMPPTNAVMPSSGIKLCSGCEWGCLAMRLDRVSLVHICFPGTLIQHVCRQHGNEGHMICLTNDELSQMKSLDLSHAHTKAKQSLSTWLYLHSTGETAFETYKMGFQIPFPCFCITKPPMPYDDASALTLVSLCGS